MPLITCRVALIVLSGSALALQSTPAWAQASTTAGTPPNWFVYTVIFVIFLAALLAISFVRGAVANTNWSLADALSEEADITAMKEGSEGKQEPLLDSSKKPVLISELRASSSRLIALMGMLVILFMFLGFGTFALYRFALTGSMPADIDKVVNFLVAGLVLFAPYVVNKFSSLFGGFLPKR